MQSPSTAVDDVREKAEHYMSAGIPSYWRIEFEPTPAVVVLELGDDGYVEVGRGPLVTVTQPFPFTINLAALLT